MEINDWWASDGTERFWMEITDRAGLGMDLNAPQLNGAGREEWSYSLVTEAQPGDVVLHWHKGLLGRPALVGWSAVTGPLSVEEGYSWQARGTFGRARGIPTTGRGWRLQCAGLNRLARPVDSTRLRALRPVVEEVYDGLRKRYGHGRPLYLPFVLYRSGDVRAAQAYLTKFPAALVRAIPELWELAVPRPTGSRRSSERQRSSGPGRLQDPKLRKALELHAVKVAKAYYMGAGASRVEELGKPYDLKVSGLGRERHVEVKGSSTRLNAVELTVNEVAHAHNHVTDLVVVDQIDAEAGPDGEYLTSGGSLRVWTDWRPENERLSPTRFRYGLPDQETSSGGGGGRAAAGR